MQRALVVMSLLAIPWLARAQEIPVVPGEVNRNVGSAIRGFWRREDVWTAYPAVLPLVGGQDELGIALGLGYRRPPHSSAPPIAADFQVVSEFGTSGSVDVRIEYKAPGLFRDWRSYATARYQLMPHAPYLGVGNDSVGGESYEPNEGFYEYKLERWTLWTGVERQIASSLWLTAGIHSRYYVTSPRADSTTLYGLDFLNGTIPRQTHDGTAELRLGIVHDSRDAEVAPTRGLYVQWIIAQAARSDGEKHSYRRVLAEAQEFLPVTRSGRLLLALRQSLAASQDSLPFYIAWEQLVRAVPQQDGVVGSKTIRLHSGSDYMATNRAMASADLRYIIFNEPEPYWAPFRIWAAAFSDYGQLWDPGSSRRRHLWDVGAGIRFQLSKAILYGMDLGYTDRGWAVSFTDFFSF